MFHSNYPSFSITILIMLLFFFFFFFFFFLLLLLLSLFYWTPVAGGPGSTAAMKAHCKSQV
jgi:hypothetical protein